MGKKFEILNYDELPKWESGINLGKINWSKIEEGAILNTKHVEYGYNNFEFIEFDGDNQYLYLRWNGIPCKKVLKAGFLDGKIGNIMLEYKSYFNKNFKIITPLPQSKIGVMWDMIKEGTTIETNHKRYGYNKFTFIRNEEKEFLILKFNDKDFAIRKSSFLNGNIGEIIGCITREFKYEIGQRLEDNNRNLIIIDRKYHKGKNNRVWKMYRYQCNVCGFACSEHYRVGELNNEFWIEENSLKKGTGCSCCANQSIIPEINSIYAKAPWMMKWIAEEDAKRYSICNGNKIKVKCPDCNFEKEVIINKIYNRKTIGCTCGDGYSRGHKYIKNILEQLKVKYYENYKPKWCNFIYKNKVRKGEYDFIIESHKIIIEVDGGFHRKNNSMNGQTKEESQLIDSAKDRLAEENGYKVIRIYYDDYAVNKEHIINSDIAKYFDLSNIVWDKAMNFSTNNLVKLICEEWNKKQEYETTKDLAFKFNLCAATISKYLSIGNELGWCDYNPKDENKKTAIRMSQATSKKVAVYQDGVLMGIFKSVSSLERESVDALGIKLLQSAISRVCIGEKSQYKGFTFKYVENNE